MILKNRKALSTAAAVLGVLCMAGVAAAHAHMQTGTIRAGSVVTAAPANLDLNMTEGVKTIAVQVFDTNGESVAAGAPAIDAANDTHVMVPLKPSLPVGTYTVKWQATAVDGHVSSDRYKFTVAASDTAGAVRVFVNGQEVKGDVPATIINGRTMVPVRALAETLGKTVDWDADQQFVIVNDAPDDHRHQGMYKQPAGTVAPTLKLQIVADAKSGFNIRLETSNWAWAPEKANTDPTPNEGHAHLYVDGVKVARVYGPWYHLDGVTPGQHDVRVTLNANSHAEYAAEDGDVIAAAASIVKKADGSSAVETGHDEEHHDHAHGGM